MSKNNDVLPLKAKKFFRNLEKDVYGEIKTYDFNVYTEPQPKNVGWGAIQHSCNLKQAIENLQEVK